MKLTLPQQDIYFEQVLFPNDPIYNIGAKIEINGHIDIKVFTDSYNLLISQHDAFRGVIDNNDQGIFFKILKKSKTKLGFIDYSNCGEPFDEADRYMKNEFKKTFNLHEGKELHVFTLIKIKEDFYYLFSVYHHIITDGWGTSLMFQRLVQNYNEICEVGSLKTIYPFTYKDFVKDDLVYQNSSSFLEDTKYWVSKFETLPEMLLQKEFSSDLAFDSEKNYKSSRKELIIKRELYNKLDQMALEYNCSSFHLILGILYTYFGRKHQNDDFAIGIPVLNRSKTVFKKTVGLFMGVSPLRIQLNFDSTFKDLIIQIKNQLRNDYRHQRFPLGKLIQEIKAFNEKEKIFNITLSYEKQNYSTNFKNTQTRVIPLSHESERVALAIYVREFDAVEDVKIDFDYHLNYFDYQRISQLTTHFEKILNDVLIYPDKKLKELVYLTEGEMGQILNTFNDTVENYPKDKTFMNLFHEQAIRAPEKEALRDDKKSYTYLELDQCSDQIAHYLIDTFGEIDKSPISILLDRSADMIVILLGILKAGRYYIPLDRTFPAERLKYIIENSESKILINEKDYFINTVNDIQVVSSEEIFAKKNNFKDIQARTFFDETAYVIYTSGSTGNPKGVEISHKSLTNLLCSIKKKPGVRSSDLFFSVTTYSFDISILEFFVPLISGATLYIADQDTLSKPKLIIKKIEDLRPTLIQATPSFYQMLFNAGWKGDKQLKVLCGGDLLSEILAEKLLSSTLELWNMYGPTETTIWSSVKKIENSKDASNIGKPISNTQFYILDQFLSPKPEGVSGAIYIAGDGLAIGYYKNEILTNEKFIKNPFNNNSLLYETGDVGKWNHKGEIEFLGRNDNQVKIRGYRIEVGDIEVQLNQIDEIRDSVVIAKRGENQEAFLVAFVLRKMNKEVNQRKIRNDLISKLPIFMIPGVIIVLEEFPLTPNLKIDRKSLIHRDIKQNNNNNNNQDFKAPISELEKKLSEYWSILLDYKEPISIYDNFFALGGHSLNAVKLIGILEEKHLLKISLKTIFDYPTIELLADYLEKIPLSKAMVIEPARLKKHYELTPSQYNIWLASQQDKISIAYNMFAAYTFEGTIDLGKITNSIGSIIKKYEIMRTNFVEINGVPYQKVNSFDKINFSIFIEEAENIKAEEIINDLNHALFDLENDLLLRVKIIQLNNEKSILLFCTHHILMDGLSLEIFIKECIENYNNVGYKKEIKEKNLKIQYKDYSEWYNNTVERKRVENDLFWVNYLQNYKSKDSFLRDFEQNQQKGNKYSFEIKSETVEDLKKMAIKEKVTVYTLLTAVLNVLIYKSSAHTDICIGTVSSGRINAELNTQIGMFANTVVLRTEIEPDQSFGALLRNIQNDLLRINDFPNIPFGKIAQPIFDVMCVYQKTEFSLEKIYGFNDLKLTSYTVENKYSRIPIVFNFFESENGLKGFIDYNNSLFKRDTIQRIAAGYANLLDEIIKESTSALSLLNTKLEFKKDKAFDFNFDF